MKAIIEKSAHADMIVVRLPPDRAVLKQLIAELESLEFAVGLADMEPARPYHCMTNVEDLGLEFRVTLTEDDR